MQYRRAKIDGGTYFFTLVTENRQEFLCEPERVSLLRNAFQYVMERHPFKIDAFILLPDHLHCMWTLPESDRDFSTCWRLIKSYFSRHCNLSNSIQPSLSRQKKQEKAIWQRRFWEHCIKDEMDFKNHVDYIHYNPVKHELVRSPKDWEYSSFHRYVRQGVYNREWGSDGGIKFDSSIGKE